MELQRYSRKEVRRIIVGAGAFIGLAWILATGHIDLPDSISSSNDSLDMNCYMWEGEARSEWDNSMVRQSGTICTDEPKCPAPFDQHCISVTERPTER